MIINLPWMVRFFATGPRSVFWKPCLGSIIFLIWRFSDTFIKIKKNLYNNICARILLECLYLHKLFICVTDRSFYDGWDILEIYIIIMKIPPPPHITGLLIFHKCVENYMNKWNVKWLEIYQDESKIYQFAIKVTWTF